MPNNSFSNAQPRNMVPPPAMGMGVPLLSTMLLANGAPEFSGRPEDWREFSRDFLEYMENACLGSQGMVSDQQRLMLLGNCLDKRTQRSLRTKRDINPDLTFEDYWRELKTHYGGDMDGNRRRAWENISLENPRELDIHTLHAFETELGAAIQRNPHLTEVEIEKKS